MRVALAQINSSLGEFASNKDKILSYVQRAVDRRCDLVVCPEAALFGYHPVDLLERPSVVAEQMKVLGALHRQLPKGIGLLVGAIVPNMSRKGKPFWNAAVFLERGKKPQYFAKELLPTYDVFDEGRHIEPGLLEKNILKFRGQKILITICEDIWAWPTKRSPRFSHYQENPLKKLKPKQFDLVINMSASPFTANKLSMRRVVVRNTARYFKVPMVYVNLVGAQDELIFDGASFAINAKGKIFAQSLRFNEDFNVVDLSRFEGSRHTIEEDPANVCRQALVLGIRDFVNKTGFSKVLLGLSGGIDSAVVACLATDALGPMNVLGVSLPGPFTSEGSRQWAHQLVENLGMNWLEVGIEPMYQAALQTIETNLGKNTFGLMNENLQARIRSLLLMAIANREGCLLLGTSNKSELAMGYSTLYGDLCGALLPIGDLLKSQVYDLANSYNQEIECIPKEIILRPPTAELRPNQKDEDSLPPYAQLDPAVEKLVEGFRAPVSEVERRVLRGLLGSEFKRWQAPPILKVSDHAFGRGRRFPIAHGAKT